MTDAKMVNARTAAVARWRSTSRDGPSYAVRQDELSCNSAPQSAAICILCAGGVDHSGGIGRALGYVLDAWGRTEHPPDARVIDTRGRGHIAFFPFHLTKTLLQICWLRARGRADLLHVNLSTRGSTARKIVVAAVARMIGVPYIVHLHGSNYDGFFRAMPTPIRRLIRSMFRGADRVLVLGEHWRRFAVDEVGVASARVDVVCNGVPPCLTTHRRAAQKDIISILFLGRLSERKGVSDLLAALSRPEIAELPWRATLAGDGATETFKSKAASLGLIERVRFPGWLDPQEVSDLLSEADMLVLPSYQEGLPVAMLEALAHRVAVVTTPVGATPEFLVDGRDAMLVAPGDVDALAGAIGTLIQDLDFRDAIAARGHATYQENFNVDVIAERIHGLYRDIVRTS